MTNNRELHEDLKQLSQYVYEFKSEYLPKGWTQVMESKPSKTGFYGAVFKKGEDVAVIYRGTNTKAINAFMPDAKSDIQMGAGSFKSAAISG